MEKWPVRVVERLAPPCRSLGEAAGRLQVLRWEAMQLTDWYYKLLRIIR